MHSHVHIYTMHSVDIKQKEEKLKHIQRKVHFPILECTAEISETKHSRVLVESSGWLSLP